MPAALRRSSAFASCAAAAAVTLLGLAGAACAPSSPQNDTGRVLRVCADPNNLPFSNEARQGFENRLAELIAGALDARLEYAWWPQRRGFVRNTLRAGLCELIIGVPADYELVATTRPYYRSSYVFVTRDGAPAPSSFDDPLLTRARVGVHLIGDDGANTPPAHALASRGIIRNVHGYSIYGDYAQPNPPARLLRAVADGELDVAVAWGPLAGYFAHRDGLSLTLTPVAPEHDSPTLPFVFDIAMGVARGNDALLAELNAIIQTRRPAIDAILDDYEVPTVPRVPQVPQVPVPEVR